MNEVNFSLTHLIILHTHRIVKRKLGKVPYGALITIILCATSTSINDDVKANKLTNVEIGKETLKKMIMR